MSTDETDERDDTHRDRVTAGTVTLSKRIVDINYPDPAALRCGISLGDPTETADERRSSTADSDAE
ncbi:hypothetical protein [Halohasta salina]|uniref:hypothetical protein n=1 Tax=Halohasta salina TaxID=2961621 RepID=UPI0020A338F5|nr:hypothetical protein [Halohasta salina]